MKARNDLIQKIVDDLNDRRGLHLSSLDEEIQREIITVWDQWCDDAMDTAGEGACSGCYDVE